MTSSRPKFVLSARVFSCRNETPSTTLSSASARYSAAPAPATYWPAAQLQYVFPLEDADAAVLQSFGYRDVAGVSVDGTA